MKYRNRTLEAEVLRAVAHFPAVLVTGPRRSGKTTLLRHLFPSCQHVLLEDPDVVARVRADPRSFLDSLTLPVILDEMQNTPELFAYVRTRIDRQPDRKGLWLLTGSQEAQLMQGVTESMAGRAAVFSLLPFSAEETPDMTLRLGGFPKCRPRPKWRTSGSARTYRPILNAMYAPSPRSATSRPSAVLWRCWPAVAARCLTRRLWPRRWG